VSRIVEGAVRVLRDSIYPEADEPGHRRFVLVQLARLFIVVWRQLVRDRCTQQAASLAYQSALSLVPILVVAFASLRALRVFDSDVDTLTWLGGSFVPSASQSVAQALASLLRKTDLAALGIAGAGTLVVTAFMLLHSVDRIVSDIWRVEKHRPLYQKVLVFVVLITIVPALMAASVHFGRRFLALPRVGTFLAPLAVTFGWLFLVYRLMPATRVRNRPALVGAAIAAIALELLKVAFNLYARRLHVAYDDVYGALAYFPVFLIWLYLSWLVVLGGVQCSYTVQNLPVLWGEVLRHREEKRE
jgi:membrane protein